MRSFGGAWGFEVSGGMGSPASHTGRRSLDNFMLTAGGRAPPFGDLANCATAAGAGAGTGVQRANLFAGGWRAPDGIIPLFGDGHKHAGAPAPSAISRRSSSEFRRAAAEQETAPLHGATPTDGVRAHLCASAHPARREARVPAGQHKTPHPQERAARDRVRPERIPLIF